MNPTQDNNFGLSIIVTHQDKPSDLNRFLKNFLAVNSHYPAELIILNYAPSDQTKMVIEEYQKFIFIHEIVGVDPVVKAKNGAAREAIYPYVLFTDTLVVFTANALPQAVELLNSPRIGVVGVKLKRYPPAYSNLDQDIVHTGLTFEWDIEKDCFKPKPVSYIDYPGAEYKANSIQGAVSSAFLLCLKRDFLSLDGFCASSNLTLSDSDFCLRMYTKLGKWCCSFNKQALHHANPARLIYKPDQKEQPKKPIFKPEKTCEPHTPDHDHPLNGKIAVICHVYYPEQWPQIVKLLNNIPLQFTLYVTLPVQRDEAFIKIISRTYPAAIVSVHPNRGKDIAPFITLLPPIINEGYELVLKLHTKRDHPQYGGAWRRLMYKSLLGSPETVMMIINSFTADPALGIVGPELLFKSIKGHLNDNLQNIRTIWGLDNQNTALANKWGFFAGSCYWVRPLPLLPLAQVCKALTYEDDNAKIDGQLAHAIERLIGLYIFRAGLKAGLVTTNDHSMITTLTKTALPKELANEQIILSLFRYIQNELRL